MTTPSAQLKPYTSMLPYKLVEFSTYDGTIPRGNLYHATEAPKPAPMVIFVHGLGLVKEQYLENFFNTVSKPDIIWIGQTEDFIDGVTYAHSLPEVIEDKVFAWGVAHSRGILAMAAAIDKRIAGIIMWLPCIYGAWDKSLWSASTVSSSSVPSSSLWDAVQRNHFQLPGPTSHSATVRFWPLTDEEAARTGGSVLSGDYVRKWAVNRKKMAEQGGNRAFIGELTLMSIWEDFVTNPSPFLKKIALTPLLWIMASDDVVCGPLEWTKGEYDKLKGPKEICVLEGEHLPQYFDPGFGKSVEVMFKFLENYAV